MSQYLISYSEKEYESKPKSKEIGAMNFITKFISLFNLIELIMKGHAFCSNMKSDGIFGISNKKDENFSSTQYISLDIDDANGISMYDFVGKLDMKPTIAYETFSSTLAKPRYRLIYLFDSLITDKNQYIAIYEYLKGICESNGVKVDKCTRSVSQMIFGTSLGKSFFANSELRLSLFDGIQYKKEETPNVQESSNVKETVSVKESSKVNVEPNEELLKEICSLGYEGFIKKHCNECHRVNNTPIDLNSDEDFVVLPKGYLEIYPNKYYDRSLKRKVLKLRTDGFGRRRALFNYAMMRRIIKNDISFLELLYNAAFDMMLWIDNTVDPITFSQVYFSIKKAYKEDVEKFDVLKENLIKSTEKNNKFFKISNQGWLKIRNGLVTLNSLKKKCKGLYTQKLFNELYDSSKNANENLEYMEAHGLKISKSTYYRKLKVYKTMFNLI